MKKVMRSGQGPAEKEENLGEKLKKVGKKGGHTTPVVPFWRLQQHHHHQHQDQLLAATDYNGVKDRIIQGTTFGYIPCVVSSRKLGATLWELDHCKFPLSSRMHHQGGGGRDDLPRLRRLHHYNNARQHHHHYFYDDKRGGGGAAPLDPSPSSTDLAESPSSLRRQVVASLMQHHRAIERGSCAIQPVSPVSHGSSMEIAPYNPAVTPTSSVDIKGRIGESSYSLKTSTELLKVLNRIWSLEEQHVSNISLVKALKKELDHARFRIKELMRDQQADRREIDELMKQITEDKLIRKNKEQERISDAIQSVRDELEDERKLRKRSESLHRKLARELYEVKSSLATSVKELEKERKSRKLLEDLCDEFAWGIRDYEQELHTPRQKFDKDSAERADYDRLILHVSESWLDERMQMKGQNSLGEKNSIMEKLGSEIETFLQIKRRGQIKNNGNVVLRDPTFLRSSLESIPLNMTVSAPQDEDDENDSAGSDSHCFEIRKPSGTSSKLQENKVAESHTNEVEKPDNMKSKVVSLEKSKGYSSSLLVKFEEHMARATSVNETRNRIEDMGQRKSREGHLVEASISGKPEISEAPEDESSDEKNKADNTSGLSSNFVIGNLIRSRYTSERGNMQPENDYIHDSGGISVWRSQPSPVREWTDKLPPHDLDYESRLPPELKETALKAKLAEARSRGRLKGAKISS